MIIDKVLRLRAARRSANGWAIRAREARTAEDLVGERYGGEADHPAAAVLAAGVDECVAFADDAAETMVERRERIDRAMRLALGAQLRQLEHRLPFLATLGSAAPFIGLFGTVWGIMRRYPKSRTVCALTISIRPSALMTIAFGADSTTRRKRSSSRFRSVISTIAESTIVPSSVSMGLRPISTGNSEPSLRNPR